MVQTISKSNGSILNFKPFPGAIQGDALNGRWMDHLQMIKRFYNFVFIFDQRAFLVKHQFCSGSNRL